MKDVCLIIPAYNEEDSIVAVVESVKRFPQYDYVVVDDGSEDATPALIEKLGLNNITHETNMGLTAAFHTGVRYSYDNGYRYAVQIDADGQHDPAFVSDMVRKADEGYDIVIGSRLMAREKAEFDIARKAGSSLLRGAILLSSGERITDPTSGMRLYNRKAMAFFLRHPEYGPEPSAIAHMIRSGARVAEVPVRMYERTHGKSYLTPKRAIRYMSRELIHIFF